MTTSQKPAAAIDISGAVKSVNNAGAELDKAAARIADGVAVPALLELVKEHPELRKLDLARAVDYVSASLVESMFAGAGDDQDVVVQFDTGYVTVPASSREVLQAAIVRYLSTNSAALATALAGGKR